jgi:ATP-dependent DNA helicase RecG
LNTTQEQLQELIQNGENLTVEFKECKDNINRSVYETVCSFLNRHGGSLLLGVNDSGIITGINPESITQIRKDFITAINNPQKINPACYLSLDEYQVQGKSILYIYIPESSQVHRCNGRIFDRNEDGDIDITDHTRLVSDLYHRKQASYSENKIYPYATLDDLNSNLLATIRKIVSNQRKNHIWTTLDDMELLKSAQLYQTDRETGKSGITLAGILLLGKDSTIHSVVPHHRTDLILRKINLDRYDDRDDVRTNLVESYDRIMAFIAKHLPDPFYLEGDIRISLRDTIFREVASNMLIHREYLNPFPAKLIIERGQVRTENSNKPHGFGPINPNTFSPYPKNPVIAQFFREIGRADELGSGVRNMMKYGKTYGGSSPELIEGDIFRINIKYPDIESSQLDSLTFKEEKSFSELPSGLESRLESGLESRLESGLAARILMAVRETPLGRSQIAKNLGHLSVSSGLHKQIRRLVELGFLEMTLPSSPKSRLQKYRLTSKAHELFNTINISIK